MPSKKYLQLVQPRLKEIKAWARDGLTEEKMAERLGIAYSTFNNYKNDNLELLEALKKCKAEYDNEVVDALHNNTLGGTVRLLTPIKCKVRTYKDGKIIKEEEVIKDAYREEYIKPDTTAQIYWLNNRQPEQWSNKPVSQGQTDEQEKGITFIFTDTSIEGAKDG